MKRYPKLVTVIKSYFSSHTLYMLGNAVNLVQED